MMTSIKMTALITMVIVFYVMLMNCGRISATRDARRLYDYLVKQRGYDPTVRPVKRHDSIVLLFMNLSLVQILDVDEKNQIITMNMWVNQEWKDPNFIWDPLEYGNVTELHIPSREIWTPDLVLYNNAGGDWDLASSSHTKVTVKYDGSVLWKPPIIFKSQCEIDVEFFPFDTQNCSLKIGTWTHNGHLIDLRHTGQKPNTTRSYFDEAVFDNCMAKIHYAIDLTQFVANVEFDLLSVEAMRHLEFYPCCSEPYVDIRFFVILRRRTLFYGVNLICPCLAISFLTVLVFYLPADSGEKMSLSISILLSLTVFFLLIFEISPPTSIVVPLILKYLLFTMILVVMSVMTTVVILNIHWRSPDTHEMSPWVKRVFTKTLPRLLFMRKPEQERRCYDNFVHLYSARTSVMEDQESLNTIRNKWQSRRAAMACDSVVNEIEFALEGVRKIVEHIHKEDEYAAMRDDWKYVAVVLDRLFLWLFSIAVVIGMLGIFMQAPTLTDFAEPLTSDNAPNPNDVNVTKLVCVTKNAS